MKQIWLYILSFFGNPEYLKLGGVARSPHWPSVRKAFIAKNPCCAVCGTKDDLDVHHCFPFHLKPMLELEEGNLITLCTPHHLFIGHLMNYRSYNVTVREDASAWRKRILERPKVEAITH